MRYIHPNRIVVELADDGVVPCYYPACERTSGCRTDWGRSIRLSTPFDQAITRVWGTSFQRLY